MADEMEKRDKYEIFVWEENFDSGTKMTSFTGYFNGKKAFEDSAQFITLDRIERIRSFIRNENGELVPRKNFYNRVPDNHSQPSDSDKRPIEGGKFRLLLEEFYGADPVQPSTLN